MDTFKRLKIAHDHSQTAHAPSDAVSLATVKADTDINSAISLKHSNSLDHSHSNKATLDNVQEALTTTLKSNYDTAYTHSQSAHAPSNAEPNVQADWNQVNISADDYIKNKPTIPVVSDDPYDANSWNGNTDAPTKNAVRDKFESLTSGGITQAQARRIIRR